MSSAATASTTGSPGVAGRDRAYPVPAGPSIIEMIWSRLVEETSSLLDLDGWGTADAVKCRQIGKCLGLAEALSILLNPYNPNIEEVRTEVMRRIRIGEQE